MIEQSEATFKTPCDIEHPNSCGKILFPPEQALEVLQLPNRWQLDQKGKDRGGFQHGDPVHFSRSSPITLRNRLPAHRYLAIGNKAGDNRDSIALIEAGLSDSVTVHLQRSRLAHCGVVWRLSNLM